MQTKDANVESVADSLSCKLLPNCSEIGIAGALGLSQAASYAFITSDCAGTITFANAAAETLFGFPAGEMAGKNIDVIVPARFRASHDAGLARMVQGAPSKLAGRTIEVMAQRQDGTEFPAEFTLSVWRDQFGLGLGAILRDISEWRARDERLLQLAHHDPLTGLLNRVGFEEVLQAELSAGKAVAILMLDLDGFKEVNDRWGHATGDAVLQALAIRLPAWLPEEALFARLGGDEFVVLLRGTEDPISVASNAASLLDALTTPLAVDGHTFHLGVSIGATVSPSHGNHVKDLLSNADLALYRAKQDGKRRFRLFEPVMRSALSARLALQDELRHAVQTGEFVLHYQPQVALETKTIFGVEALLRWRHPERGLLMPGYFISQLEEHPLALEVGRWALNEACQQAAAWRQAGLHGVRMSVNLFAAQVYAGTLATDVRSALERHRLKPEELELEVTETIALRADGAILVPFQKLRGDGVGIAFDDFGTGYASLSSLKRFPLTRLKIDRGFVRDLGSEPHDAAVVRSIIQIGKDVGLEVIAEGIETSAQEAMLLQMGCAQGQGFRYGKAMPAAQLGHLLECASTSRVCFG